MTLASAVYLSTFSNTSPLETTGPIGVKFHLEANKDWRTKVYSNDPSAMTKIAAAPSYSKNSLKYLLWNQKAGTSRLAPPSFMVLSSNDDPKLTLTYLKVMSNMFPNAMAW